MTQRARHLGPESPERTGRGGRVASRAPAAARVLELQRSAGNQAVLALLARAPKGGKPAPAKPAPAETPRGTHAVVEGVGTIPLLSYQWGVGRGVTVGGTHGEGHPQVNELVITSELGEHSAALARAATDGRPGTVEVVTMKDGKPYLRITLEGALISSYSASGPGGGQTKPTETWTINADAIKWELVGADLGDPGGSRPAPGSEWDLRGSRG